jgi:putative transposase
MCIMRQRWCFRCYPTSEQARVLARTFGCCRFVYNWALAARTKAFKDGGRMTYAQSDKAMTLLKRQPETAWLNEVSSVPLQQALRHLQSAFANFFGKRAAYPVFKQKRNRQTAGYTTHGFRFEIGNRRLLIAKLGYLKVKWSRRVEVQPTTVTIIREPSGRYFVSMVLDVPALQSEKTGAAVGVDFGVARLATLSNGERIANPKYGARYQRRMAFLQRAAARKRKGSNRRESALRKVARLHETIADCRKDTLAKLALSLVRRFDTIYVEDLNLRGMVKNHSLARSLSDAGIGTAIRMIEQKAAMHGKTVVKIDRFFPSSKTCNQCGLVNRALTLSGRSWKCECGAVHDRDENAARNILAVGQTVTAHGAGVRAVRDTSRKASLRRSANQLKHRA